MIEKERTILHSFFFQAEDGIRYPLVTGVQTCALPICLKPDVAVIGASGGGLAAGISLAIKARAPNAKIYTAEPEGFDDTARSFKSGKHEHNARLSGSICDALMSNTPGTITFEINRSLIGEGVAASDEEVGRAVAFAFRELKLVVEPG